MIEKIKKYNIPIIFVTAKESVLDRVKGLRLGAEDYIIKPFETIELLARIEVVLRRYNKDDSIKFKNIEVDAKQRIVKVKDKEVYLTAKEYDLLILFLQNKNMALSREQILDRVWGFEDDSIKFKNIEVDTKQRIVKVKDKEVYLTAKEYDLLILFLQNKNMALSREQILDRVWGFEYEGETRTVDIHVQRIREKLGLKNSIKTVFKVGYRLEE